MLISIVVPVFNEEDNIQNFYHAVTEVMRQGTYDYEFIFVDDGSKDRSAAILQALSQDDQHVKVLLLARNFGHQLALTCGLDYAKGDADYIEQLGAKKENVTVTGNMKYDQTYATVIAEEKQELLEEFGFHNNHPIIVAGSTHKGEEEILFKTFQSVLHKYPQARLLIAPREIYRGHDVSALAKKFGLASICRSDMTEPVHEGIPVVVLDTIGELGRLYSLGDIIFVGGSLVKTGGHNILEPAAHGKPIIVGPYMFNFKDIFALLNNFKACVSVKDGKALTAKVLELCENKDLAQEMSQNCITLMHENRGATQRNIQEIRKLFESLHIIP